MNYITSATNLACDMIPALSFIFKIIKSTSLIIPLRFTEYVVGMGSLLLIWIETCSLNNV